MLDTPHPVCSVTDIKVQQANQQSKPMTKKNCNSLVWPEGQYEQKRNSKFHLEENESAARDEVFSCSNDSAVQFNDD